MLLRLLAWMGWLKLIWLQSYNGEIFLTVKRKSPFGGHWANVYPIARIGRVTLNTDGTCEGVSCYIKHWRDY